MEESEEARLCQLCGGKNSNSELADLVPLSRLANYLAHQNLLEMLLKPTPKPESTAENNSGVPKLSFNLVPNYQQNPENLYFLLCSNCSSELAKLDEFNSHLESLKKLVESQVQKIHGIRQRSEQTLEISQLQIPMRGWTEGYENVWSGWHALGNILQTVVSSPFAKQPENCESGSSTTENGNTEESVDTQNGINAEMNQPSPAVSPNREHSEEAVQENFQLMDVLENVQAENPTNVFTPKPEATETPALSVSETVQVTPASTKEPKPALINVKCSICSKIYHSKQAILRHIRSHAEPQLACPHCPRKFGTRERLDMHMTGHTEERPFLCKICGATFGTLSNLNKHKYTPHKRVWRFKCPDCVNWYSDKSVMIQHFRRCHTSI